MSLYIRIETSFYSHRKTLRLRTLIGNDAFWVPPRIWAYAASHQPNGDFSDYSPQEIATAIDYQGDAKIMLQALLQAGFFERKPLKIHDWHQYNGILDFFSKRAKKAADARWEKERTKEKGSEQYKAKHSIAEASIASSNASSIQPTKAAGNTQPLAIQLLASLGPLYKRPENQWPTETEMRAACEVLKRPAWETERAEIDAFYNRIEEIDVPFQKPRHLLRLLEQWSETLDKARTYAPRISPAEAKKLADQKQFVREMLK